jgi:hypothetical protein
MKLVTQQIASSFVFVVFLQSALSFAQEKTPKKRHLWEILGDAVSEILPHGTGSIRRDNSGVDSDGVRQFDPTGPGSAASTHMTTFGPTYLAAMIVETAASPFVLTGKHSVQSLEDSTRNSKHESQKEEIDELKKEIERLKREQKILDDKLKSQAEEMIDSYEKPGKVGEVGPELNKYLKGTRLKIAASLAYLAHSYGLPADAANAFANKTLRRISDLDLAKEFLVLSEKKEIGE